MLWINVTENTKEYADRNGIKPKEEKISQFSSATLPALTAAALILPGMLQPAAQAAEDGEIDFQYSHFQEGKRDLFNTLQNFNPIEVDSIKGSGKFSLTDRIKFAFNYTQDTWGGATPISTAPLGYGGNRNPLKTDATASASPIFRTQTIYLDKNFNPKAGVVNEQTGAIRYVKSKQLVHTLSVASPETRKQGDFKLGYDWDNAALDIGGGISVEDDYESRFGSINSRFDFNQKQTSLNLGLSYTNSDTSAISDHDLGPYAEITRAYSQRHLSTALSTNAALIQGNREDWAVNLGLTQILNKNALLETGMSFTRSTGFLSNPYKYSTFIFVDPHQKPLGAGSDAPGSLAGSGRTLLEQRPEERNQLNWTIGYKHYFEMLDAALHFNYSYFHDDWKINAHTFQADWGQSFGNGWTITPAIRYYSQNKAYFYQPYFISHHADPGRGAEFDAIVPAFFSSDHRLSGFGTLSGGVTVSKQFAKGLAVEAGFEYYTHQGALKLGGGGEGNYSDFDFWVANAALKLDLAALGQASDSGAVGHSNHHHGHQHQAPAGIMFAHTLDKAGDMMAGYRYMYSRQAGNMLHSDRIANELALQNKVCLNGAGRLNQCFTVPVEMTMHMHMLDLMYAPADWLTLMLMPQFTDMNMFLRPGASIENANIGNASGHIEHHLSSGHETGGVGDTGMYALFKLWDKPHHHINAGLGFSAPTGDAGIQLRRNHQLDGGFIHYGMQLGSGTWDFKPSLTYTGENGPFSWGAQLSGTKRMESRNSSNFSFGDIFQGTVWGGYQWTDWLSSSVRGVYTWQGAINGRYPKDNIEFKKSETECPRFLFEFDDGTGHMFFDEASYKACLQSVVAGNRALLRENDAAHRSNPADFPANYGGQMVDLGLGLNVNIPDGAFAGHSLAFEWLQPVYTDFNGYQLDRDGALSFTWSYGF